MSDAFDRHTMRHIEQIASEVEKREREIKAYDSFGSEKAMRDMARDMKHFEPYIREAEKHDKLMKISDSFGKEQAILKMEQDLQDYERNKNQFNIDRINPDDEAKFKTNREPPPLDIKSSPIFKMLAENEKRREEREKHRDDLAEKDSKVARWGLVWTVIAWASGAIIGIAGIYVAILLSSSTR